MKSQKIFSGFCFSALALFQGTALPQESQDSLNASASHQQVEGAGTTSIFGLTMGVTTEDDIKSRASKFNDFAAGTLAFQYEVLFCNQPIAGINFANFEIDGSSFSGVFFEGKLVGLTVHSADNSGGEISMT